MRGEAVRLKRGTKRRAKREDIEVQVAKADLRKRRKRRNERKRMKRRSVVEKSRNLSIGNQENTVILDPRRDHLIPIMAIISQRHKV
jgi:hypothetical protein